MDIQIHNSFASSKRRVPNTSTAAAPCPVELLSFMLGLDGMSGQGAAIPARRVTLARFVQDVATAWDLRVTIDPSSALGDKAVIDVPSTGEAGTTLLLVGYVGTAGTRMIERRHDGDDCRDYEVGCGGSSAKAAAAAMLAAVCRYARIDERPNRVVLLLVMDAEAGAEAITNLVTWDLDVAAIVPTWAIIGKPTGLMFASIHGGSIRFRVHCSRDSNRNGTSAINALAGIASQLEREYLPKIAGRWHPLVGTASCMVTIITSGTGSNAIALEPELVVDRRILPFEDHDTVRAEFEAEITKLTGALCIGVAIATQVVTGFPPVIPGAASLNPGTSTGAISDTIRDLCSERYLSEAGSLGSLGIPTVLLGPGSIGPAHMIENSIQPDQVIRAADLYLAAMQTMFDYEPSAFCD